MYGQIVRVENSRSWNGNKIYKVPLIKLIITGAEDFKMPNICAYFQKNWIVQD